MSGQRHCLMQAGGGWAGGEVKGGEDVLREDEEMEGLKKNRNEVDSVLVNQALLISIAAALSNSFFEKYGFLFWIAPQLFNYINYFFIQFFLAEVRDRLSAGGIKGETSRDGNFGHSPTTKGARESRGRQPSKNAH